MQGRLVDVNTVANFGSMYKFPIVTHKPQNDQATTLTLIENMQHEHTGDILAEHSFLLKHSDPMITHSHDAWTLVQYPHT